MAQVEYKFDFEDFHDFAKFVDTHKDVIDKMGGEGEDRLSDQIKRQVVNNEQLPEHFTFTGNQYLMMMKADRQGMQAMEQDNRVTVNKTESD